MSFFVTLETLFGLFLFFFVPTFLGHMAILLQLKHFNLLSLNLSLDFPISIGCLYIVFVSVLQFCHPSVDLYTCPTELIAAFHSLSDSDAAIDGYSSMVLIMSCYTFFFNRKIAYNSSVFAFIAKALNSIMKSAVFFFPCLKNSILHLTSTAFVLSLNVVLSSLTNSSQSQVSNSSSSPSTFFCIYIPTTSFLRYIRITVILSLVSMTLLLLKNNCISFHQFSNFIQSLLNHSGFGTIFFGITACTLLFVVTGTGALDISLSDCLYVSSKALFIICKNLNFSNSASISSVHLELILILLMVYTTHVLFYHLAVTSPNLSVDLTTIYLSFCKVSLLTLYQIL